MLKTRILVLCGLLLAGCVGATPHSEYFVVTFTPLAATPTAQGAAALANAVSEAAGGPSSIIIRGAAPAAGGAAEALTQQRAAAAALAFTKAGIAKPLLHTAIDHVEDQEFAERKDTLIVQLVFGTAS